ncbi:hypothetical protein SLA2020_168520 [Shorea laevis]
MPLFVQDCDPSHLPGAVDLPVYRPHKKRYHKNISCMTNPRRVKMVAQQIRGELSDMLLTDKVLQYAVSPEAAWEPTGNSCLPWLTTISNVEVSADLQVVKVYVSVFGDEIRKEFALAGLKSKAKYVHSKMGKPMKLRLTPEARFIEDEYLERGSRVIAILDRIKANKKIAEAEDEERFNSSDSPQDDKEWEDSDTDEDIIHVK